MWLCQRLNLPLFTIRSGIEKSDRRYLFTSEGAQSLLHREDLEPTEDATRTQPSVPLPVYYLFIPYIPIGLAIFIAGTQYFDFRNHGIDVIAGAAGQYSNGLLLSDKLANTLLTGGVFSAYVGISWTNS